MLGLVNNRGFDVGVEAAGFRFPVTWRSKISRAVGLETDTADLITELFKVVRKWGRVSLIADYVGVANNFPIGLVMSKHLTIRSGQTPCQALFPTVLEHLRKGDIDPLLMVSHRITMEDVPTAYEKLYNKQEGFIKVLVEVSPEEAERGRQGEKGLAQSMKECHLEGLSHETEKEKHRGLGLSEGGGAASSKEYPPLHNVRAEREKACMNTGSHEECCGKKSTTVSHTTMPAAPVSSVMKPKEHH